VFTYSLEDALEWTRKHDSGTYIDAHSWVFVPASFSLMMLELARLGFIDWRVDHSEAAEYTEFYVWMQRGALARMAAMSGADLAAERMRLLCDTALELDDQRRQFRSARSCHIEDDSPRASETIARLKRAAEELDNQLSGTQMNLMEARSTLETIRSSRAWRARTLLRRILGFPATPADATAAAEVGSVISRGDDSPPRMTSNLDQTLREHGETLNKDGRAIPALQSESCDKPHTIRERPWPLPRLDECYWYHTMHFPEGETIEGTWSIPSFEEYIGGYDVKGKTVLDVGTASGYIAFNAEKAGATVTALDARSAEEFRHVPFLDSESYSNIAASKRNLTTGNLIPVKNSWWYGWHRLKSNVECIYAPHGELFEWDRSFDVVIAGAIVEHLSDPVYSIGAWARVAREALIIPWTDIVPSDELMMIPMTPWTNATFNYAWWKLSEGLWKRLLSNVGFDFSFKMSRARNNAAERDRDVQRPVIVATRRK